MISPAYSIVVPAYNESARIGPSLQRILDYLTHEHWDAEVVVVNDGSRDDTAALVRAVAERDARVRLIENPGNRGKGYSVRNGMLHARGEALIFSDADLSSPIQEAAKLTAAIREGADVAIGSRWLRPELMTERQPLYRQLFGRLFNLLLRVALGLKFRDTQCGLKAFTRHAALQVFPRQRIERWGFDPEILFLAQRAGLRIVEVPVEWAHDERSKINPLVDGIKMFLELLRVRWYALTGKYGGTVQPVPAASYDAAARRE
ncbi:MAG: dolichyl-phosphate beta-glucosyltransferase [Terriglobales bacterium]